MYVFIVCMYLYVEISKDVKFLNFIINIFLELNLILLVLYYNYIKR